MNSRTASILGIVVVLLFVLIGVFLYVQKQREQDREQFRLRIGDKNEIIIREREGKIRVWPFVDVEYENKK